jgi:beta-mannanase
VATVRISPSWRPVGWIALSLVLLSGALAPLARAEEARGTNREASLTYEPVAGYDAPPRKPGRLAPATGSLMGTHSHDSTQINPEDQGIVHLEEALGRKMDINNHYHGGWTDIAEDGLSWLEYWDVENGRIPLVGWGCHDSNRIISGSEDDVIRKTAQQMKAFGHEFFMRYCWEMDGSRKQGTVKGPKQFVAAWQRMHRIFQEEGATNVIWTWTANAAGFKDKRKYSNNEPPGPYFYPGDEYVDWVAADGYNWGVSKRNQGDRWRQVLEIFDEFMIFARTTSRPIMIGEYGAQEQDEDPEAKPEWMRHAHDVLINKPKTPECKHCGAFSDVAAVVYFDVDYGSHGDWRIMSSPESLQAFKQASDDPWFHQLDSTSWAPKVNRSNPQQPSQYGPGWKPGKPSDDSSPPPEQTNSTDPAYEPQPETAEEPSQSDPAQGQSDPAQGQSDPAQGQSGQPAPSGPSDPASQSDPGGQSSDQSDSADQADEDSSSDQGKGKGKGKDSGKQGKANDPRAKQTRQKQKKG